MKHLGKWVISPLSEVQSGCTELRNSPATALVERPDRNCVICEEWLQSALAGIREMHIDEDVRREVAKRLF
jgi:hypothetical protein